MKVLVYEIEISDDTCLFIHGFTRYIKEAYFPVGRLFLNSEGCFHPSELDAQNRLKAAINLKEQEIDVDAKVIEKIIVLLEEERNAKSSLEKARTSLMEWVKKHDSK